MIVYRIGRTKYAGDIKGEGARLNGGRWNHKLTPCLYTSENRALAVLEYTVNIQVDDIPRALSLSAIEISTNNILELSVSELPGNWREFPAPASTKDFGTALLKKADFAVIKMPSAVIPFEFNYILNPLHRDSTSFLIITSDDFLYDIRIKR